MLLKIIAPCLQVLRLADGKKTVMYQVFYYDRMTRISIIKSASDLDNKELFPLSRSSFLRYGVNLIVTLNRNRIFILMI